MRRFVLLEHRWNGIHWDLMLEEEGALTTWAIDAPIVPAIDLPARALSAHRIDYLSYEGEVSGGRGTVRRVDEGFYEIRVWTPDRVHVRLAGRQLVGEAGLRRVKVGPPGEAASWIFRLGNLD